MPPPVATFTPKRFPLYYCPPGIARPAHIAAVGGTALLDGAGPDGKAGTMYGGPWSPQQDGWAKTAAGWWVRMGQTKPSDLQRTIPLPGLSTPGAITGHHWIVPTLLQPRGDVPDWLVVRAYGLNGTASWQPMQSVVELVERLRNIGHATDAETETLAIDLLAANHHVCEHELIVAGWLTRPMIPAILLTARGITDDLRRSLNLT